MFLSRKILLSVAAVGAAASIASLGTYATFTDSESATTGNVSTGTVDIALGATGASNRLSVGATGLVPGDTLQRRVVLSNAGSEDLAAITLSTTAPVSSILDTDATDGLQMTIESCSVAWVEAGPPYTYTCAGSTSTVLASRAVIGSPLTLTGLNSVTAAGADDLRVTLELPTTADNTFQAKTSTITYTFDATQRAATAK